VGVGEEKVVSNSKQASKQASKGANKAHADEMGFCAPPGHGIGSPTHPPTHSLTLLPAMLAGLAPLAGRPRDARAHALFDAAATVLPPLLLVLLCCAVL
jgi:hypothetical protein